MKEKYMKEAIRLSLENVEKGGGPFGAVIVKNDEIISKGANAVIRSNDPTAHAEVIAIRDAARKLNSFDLSGCIIYTSCEPCPMCLGAIYWAHIDEIYYGNTKADAKNIGFDDSFIYDEIEKPHPKRKIKTKQLMQHEAFKAFKAWDEIDDKIKY